MRFPLGRRRARAPRPTAARLAPIESLEARTLTAADLQALRPGPTLTAAEVGRQTPSTAAHALNARFVEWISTALVATPLSAAEQARLLGRIDHGGSRQRAVALVLSTRTGRQAEVETTFEELLHRAPTARELARFQGKGGVDQSVLIGVVVQSREYFQTRGGGTNAGFLQALTADLLGRPATAAESAAWLRQLDSGVPRSRFVASFLASPVYIQRATERIAWHATPESIDPLLVQQVRTGWRGPHPLTTAKAIAYGSEAFLRRFPDPAIVAPQAPADWVSGNGIVPRFSLNTVWQHVPVGHPGSYQAAGASPQGTLWIGNSQALSVRDLTSQTSRTVWSGFVDSVAPISDTEAWFIGEGPSDPAPIVAKLTVGGVPAVVAPLPSGDLPVQIAASTDGLVWVLGQSGTVYSYQTASQSWVTIASNGFRISQISVGSATNVWAIGAIQGSPVLLQWVSGTGWTHDSFFDGTSPNAVAAAADGSVWVANTVLGPEVYLRRAGGSWSTPVPHQKPPGAIFALTALDENRVAASIGSSLSPVSVLSVGVVDRPAVAFPTPTSQWDVAYQGITTYFNLGALPNGIRSTYPIGTSNFDYYVDQLTVRNGQTTMPTPAGVDPANWVVVADQIVQELLDAQAVQSLFNQLILVNNAMAKVSQQGLQNAVNYVGLTQQEQSNTLIDLGIGTLFESAVAGIATLFSGGAATVAAVFAAYADAGISELTGQSSPGPNTTYQAAYADLYNDMTNLFDTTSATYGTDLATITGDYGKLSAVGSIVRSFVWSVVDGSQEVYANAARPSVELKYMQDLSRVKWQVIEVQNRICTVEICAKVNTPDYDRYDQVLEQYSDGLRENLWFAHELGASTNPFLDPGPYPSPQYFQYLFNPPVPPSGSNQIPGLGVVPSDYFEGKNGWNLSKVIVPG